MTKTKTKTKTKTMTKTKTNGGGLSASFYTQRIGTRNMKPTGSRRPQSAG